MTAQEKTSKTPKMPKTIRECVTVIDREVQKLTLKGYTDEGLLVEMTPYMPMYKRILDSLTHHQIQKYAEQYDGFYYYSKLLEKLATMIEQSKR
ncbi:hypothetical protein [Cysteiniphilum sp. 6C5]|uniref:hypothetical protein n=1 Tax=unclassified Cysteiniphilum TaxID=2610889 RepID=UPI003F84F901